MKRGVELKDYVDIDGTRYWNYTFGGKWSSSKFVVINNIHWYDTNRPPVDSKPE